MYRIMIIDDDPTSLAIGRALLEHEYELTLVRSGHQALGSLDGDNIPDIILLDIIMPDMNGIDVLMTIKKNNRLKDIPVIFLTAESSLNKAVQGFSCGASDFVEKPVDPDLLRIKIKQQIYILELKHENDAMKETLRLLKKQFDDLTLPYLS